MTGEENASSLNQSIDVVQREESDPPVSVARSQQTLTVESNVPPVKVTFYPLTLSQIDAYTQFTMLAEFFLVLLGIAFGAAFGFWATLQQDGLQAESIARLETALVAAVIAGVLFIVVSGYLIHRRHKQRERWPSTIPAGRSVERERIEAVSAPVFQDKFQDDFQGGLGNWTYQGGWKTQTLSGQSVLLVENSERGGIATPCRSWDNYLFEFETMIVRENSSWLIRARDTENYVMLQCMRNRIRPHYRLEGVWSDIDWIERHTVTFRQVLPTEEWFPVQITVRGKRVRVALTRDGSKTTIFDDVLIERIPESSRFFAGSVGFRQSPQERALFRNVRVQRIQ